MFGFGRKPRIEDPSVLLARQAQPCTPYERVKHIHAEITAWLYDAHHKDQLKAHGITGIAYSDHATVYFYTPRGDIRLDLYPDGFQIVSATSMVQRKYPKKYTDQEIAYYLINRCLKLALPD